MLGHKKIVVVGDGACGKTCLLTTFTKNEFPEEYVPTIYETSTKNITIDEGELELTLWDTAGEEDYDRLRPLSYPKTDCVIMCFGIDNPNSLENIINKWAPEIKNFLPKVQFMLVGNKLDLRSDPEVIRNLKKSNMKPVSLKEGMKCAKSIHASAYIECSSRTLANVKKVFETAAKLSLIEKKSKPCHIV